MNETILHTALQFFRMCRELNSHVLNHQEQQIFSVHHPLMQQSNFSSQLCSIYRFIFSRALDSVTDAAKAHFREAAEKILETRDALDALSAALACISGTTHIVPRSLLTKKEVNRIFCLFPLVNISFIL